MVSVKSEIFLIMIIILLQEDNHIVYYLYNVSSDVSKRVVVFGHNNGDESHFFQLDKLKRVHIHNYVVHVVCSITAYVRVCTV